VIESMGTKATTYTLTATARTDSEGLTPLDPTFIPPTLPQQPPKFVEVTLAVPTYLPDPVVVVESIFYFAWLTPIDPLPLVWN